MITTTTTRREYIDQLESLLKRLDTAAAEWETRIKEAANGNNHNAEDILDTLKEKRELAVRKLKNVQDASEQAWDDLADGAVTALQNLDEAFSKARERFSN